MTITLEESLFLKPKSTQKYTPKALARIQRQDKFISTLLTKKINFNDACKQHSISRKTGYNWFDKWKQREGIHVDVTWWQLLEEVCSKNPAKALECLTRIKYRMTKETIEAKSEITQTQKVFHLHMWKPEQIAES